MEHRLKLVHPQTNKVYFVTVNDADKKKFENDIIFAQKFFNHVLINYRDQENCVQQKENCDVENQSYIPSTDCTSPPEGFTTTLTKGCWSHNETLSLITSVESRYEEMYHPKKRKYIWENVSNDLVSHGYEYSSAACYKKWHNLLRTYKACKDSKKKTGRGANRFLYYDRMDEILGDKPNNSSPHSIDVLSQLNNQASTSTTATIKRLWSNSSSSAEDTATFCSDADSYESVPVNITNDTNSSENVHTQNDQSKKKKENRQSSLQKIKSNYYKSKEEELKKRREEKHSDFLLNLEVRKENEARKLMLYERKLNIEEKKIELEERRIRALEELVKQKNN